MGSSGGGTTAVTCNLRTYYTLYSVCVITCGRTRGAAASWRERNREAATGNWSRHNWEAASWSGRNRGTAAEADTVHSTGSSSWSGRSLGTRPNQGGDRFQYPAPKNGLGYSLSPIRSVPRNVWGQEIDVRMKYLRWLHHVRSLI